MLAQNKFKKEDLEEDFIKISDEFRIEWCLGQWNLSILCKIYGGGPALACPGARSSRRAQVTPKLKISDSQFGVLEIADIRHFEFWFGRATAISIVKSKLSDLIEEEKCQGNVVVQKIIQTWIVPFQEQVRRVASKELRMYVFFKIIFLICLHTYFFCCFVSIGRGTW